MKAGRDLDVLIATKLLGWIDNKENPRMLGVWGIMDWYKDGRPMLSPNCEPYSTSIGNAYQVVGALVELGYSVDCMSNPKDRKWLTPEEGVPANEWKLEPRPDQSFQCRLCKYDPDFNCWIGVTDQVSDSLPHAICLAALEVLK